MGEVPDGADRAFGVVPRGTSPFSLLPQFQVPLPSPFSRFLSGAYPGLRDWPHNTSVPNALAARPGADIFTARLRSAWHALERRDRT